MPRQWDHARIAALFAAIVWTAVLADAQTLAAMQGLEEDSLACRETHGPRPDRPGEDSQKSVIQGG